MPSRKVSTKKRKADPVAPDQGGRSMAIDPSGPNMTREEAVRRRAYELYERRGKKAGHEVEDWLEAESQFTE